MLIFMLAVFVTSMYTDGYLWGVLASLASVLAVNFAFFTPYFAFNFTLPENLFSGLVMLAVSIMTSTLTTRVKKQEQLHMETEREKMRANLLRAVSHDLRTPLTSIYGACSTVTENYDSLGKEQALKLLREACEDAQWLNRMVENLLSVTRFDGEQVAVKKTPTVLEELLDAVLVKFKKRCPDVPVQLELPEDFVMIPMDSMLIQQVLMNLLENAVLHAECTTTLSGCRSRRPSPQTQPGFPTSKPAAAGVSVFFDRQRGLLVLSLFVSGYVVVWAKADNGDKGDKGHAAHQHQDQRERNARAAAGVFHFGGLSPPP